MAKRKRQQSASDVWSGHIPLKSQLAEARQVNAKLLAENERLECLAGGLMFACEALIGTAKRLMLQKREE